MSGGGTEGGRAWAWAWAMTALLAAGVLAAAMNRYRDDAFSPRVELAGDVAPVNAERAVARLAASGFSADYLADARRLRVPFDQARGAFALAVREDLLDEPLAHGFEDMVRQQARWSRRGGMEASAFRNWFRAVAVERLLERLPGVRKAKMAYAEPISGGPATAWVRVEWLTPAMAGDDGLRAIALLVADADPRLDPADIHVTDAYGRAYRASRALSIPGAPARPPMEDGSVWVTDEG